MQLSMDFLDDSQLIELFNSIYSNYTYRLDNLHLRKHILTSVLQNIDIIFYHVWFIIYPKFKNVSSFLYALNTKLEITFGTSIKKF